MKDQALAKGLGGGCDTLTFVAAVSCEEKGSGQGLIISLGESRLAIVAA